MPRHRKASGALAELLESSARPIYLVSDQRAVLFCNPACAAWAGIEAEALVGATCNYGAAATDRTAPAVAARLCPPPAAFEGTAACGWVSAVSAAGEVVFRRAEFVPLDEPATAGPLLVVLAAADAAPCDLPVAAAGPTSGEQLHAELIRARQKFAGRYALDRLLGPSAAATRVRAQVQLAASAPANVLIVGPSGSGKEHVAKAIHYRQAAATAAGLIPLSVTALDAELLLSTLESLLAKAAAGRPDAPGTLLVRDVDQLSPDVQPPLTRLLRGPTVPRVIATSGRPLAELVAAGAFQADLAALLATLTIELVPLGERIDDLPLLAQLFLEEVNAEGGRQLAGFSPEALDELAGYPWPGNLDELADMVRRAHAAAGESTITPRDLPKRIGLAADAARWPQRPQQPIDLVQTLEQIETELIQKALERAKGNKSRAAELLGLSRPRLYRRLVQLGLSAAEELVEFEELP